MTTRTPGIRYFVRQHFPSLDWQVVPVDEVQARNMKERGAKIFNSSAAAYTVRDKLQKKREAEKCESAIKS